MIIATAEVNSQPAPSAGGASSAPASDVITKPEQLQNVSAADIDAALEASIEAEAALQRGELPAGRISPPAPVTAPPAPAAAELPPAPAPAPVSTTPPPADTPPGEIPPAPAADLDDDDLPDKFRLSKGKVAGTQEWEVAKLLKKGFTMPEINARLGLNPGTAQPTAETPPAPDPVKEKQAKISEIRAQLATAIADMDSDAQVTLTEQLTDEKMTLALLQRDQSTAQERQQQEQMTAFQKADLDAKAKAEGKYPDLLNPKSLLKAETTRLHNQYVQEDRPILDDPEYLDILADRAATNLGIAPVKSGAPAAAPAHPAAAPTLQTSGIAPQPGFTPAPGSARPAAQRPITESDVKQSMRSMDTKDLDDVLEQADAALAGRR